MLMDVPTLSTFLSQILTVVSVWKTVETGDINTLQLPAKINTIFEFFFNIGPATESFMYWLITPVTEGSQEVANFTERKNLREDWGVNNNQL